MTVRILCFTNEYGVTLLHVPLGAHAPALARARVHSCIGNSARRQVRAYTNIFVSLRFPRYPLRIYLPFQANAHDLSTRPMYE